MPHCFLALHTNTELQNGTSTKPLQNICTTSGSAVTGKLHNTLHQLRFTICLVYTTVYDLEHFCATLYTTYIIMTIILPY